MAAAETEQRVKRWVLVVLIATLVVGSTPTTTSAEEGVGAETGVEIVGVYPNPVTDGDNGEFVVIEIPRDTNVSGWQLRDDESAVTLPNTTLSGRVVLSTEPAAVETATDRQTRSVAGGPDENVRSLAGGRADENVRSLAGEISLSNVGERIQLTKDGDPVSVVEYTDAPEGELYRRDGERWMWQPLGATDLPVIESAHSTVRVFVLPDAPTVPLSTIESATERILLGGYTFTSKRIARALIRAHKRGVHVEVLVEGGPVGGITTRQAAVLDRLTAAGITVHVIDGKRARYAYHHAKYAVVDNRALVMTENWKPSGVGGRSNRGWGIVVRDPAIATGLAEVFKKDTGWEDTVPWSEFRRKETFEPSSPSFETYPSTIPAQTVTAERTRLLVAPDNAGREMVELMDNAIQSIRIIQVSIEGPDRKFTQAALRASRRGVDVRILLSNAWYVREENRALAEHLNRLAENQNLPLTVRLAAPHGRYEDIHAKGVIIDGDQVVLGSLNWNPVSARENREVVVVVTGDAVGSYYSDVFDADWRRNSRQRLPVGVIAVLGIAILAALVLAKTIDFE